MHRLVARIYPLACLLFTAGVFSIYLSVTRNEDSSSSLLNHRHVSDIDIGRRQLRRNKATRTAGAALINFGDPKTVELRSDASGASGSGAVAAVATSSSFQSLQSPFVQSSLSPSATFLEDSSSAEQIIFNGDVINPNFQNLVRPSMVDSNIEKWVPTYNTAEGDVDPCSQIMLYIPYKITTPKKQPNRGHASQLNNYFLASLIATLSNKAMIVIDPPHEVNYYEGHSQFGCPKEAYNYKQNGADGTIGERDGYNLEFPSNLNRLIKHPDWLSRQCSIPCTSSISYQEWDKMTHVSIGRGSRPQEIKCVNDDGREVTVTPMGVTEVRRYFSFVYRNQMLDRHSNKAKQRAYDWAIRLGATPQEANTFTTLTNEHDIYDYVSALLVRGGIMTLQPWIARDTEMAIRNPTLNLPLNVPYDGIHIRRGDKLGHDAKEPVKYYWDMRLQHDPNAERTNYIPLVHYLSVLLRGSECNVEQQQNVRSIFIATDDPVLVQQEITDLPKDDMGHAIFNNCHRLQFIFSHDHQIKGSLHMNEGGLTADCDDRYQRNIASIVDLIMLAKSNTFVGEFNSNWGRMIRLFRLSLVDQQQQQGGVGAGGEGVPAPVVRLSDMRIAFGPEVPLPPGY